MGVLLRDVKVANILIDGDRRAKLCDFGLGRVDTQSSGEFTLLGPGKPPSTPGYVAPEMLRKERYDFKADLYSFDVCIWVLLTGGILNSKTPRPPSSDCNDYQNLFHDYQKLHDCIDSPDQHLAVKLPSGTSEELVRMLTSRNPEQRWGHQRIRE